METAGQAGPPEDREVDRGSELDSQPGKDEKGVIVSETKTESVSKTAL